MKRCLSDFLLCLSLAQANLVPNGDFSQNGDVQLAGHNVMEERKPYSAFGELTISRCRRQGWRRCPKLVTGGLSYDFPSDEGRLG